MEKLKEKLTNPFDGLKANDEKGFIEICAKIAEELLNNYGIKCESKIYYFAEVEFYYYEKNRWDKEWNEKTYPRTGKKAGSLFFHYSGFDICFESKFEEGKFGGILVRSLKDEAGLFITGPSVCSLEILNACNEQKIWPELVPVSNKGCRLCEKPITRYGITYKDKQEDRHLCFYDERLKEKLKNEFENATWDYSKSKDNTVKGVKNLVRYYHRFDK